MGRIVRAACSANIEAAKKLTVEDGHLVLHGDNSGVHRWLVHIGAEIVTLATEWGELSKAVGKQFRLSPDSAAMLLRFGFVPVPHTLFVGVYQAGIGDVLDIDLASGIVTHSYEFPYLIAKSRGCETWNADRFTDLLCASCDRIGAQGAGLLLSAGKDSTALLLALQRIGRKDVLCVTYDAGYREQEAAPASAFAREMGFQHVTVRADPRTEFDTFVSFLRSTPHLTLDFALPAALVSVAACAERGAMVLDGLGNDKYMHFSPSRRERLLRATSLPSRFGGLAWGAAGLSGFGQPGLYLTSSAAMYANERWFPGTKLSAGLIRQLTGSAEAARAFARSLDVTLRDCHIVDAVTVAKARYSDYSGAMEKTRLSAEHLGICAAFPFCDVDMIDYYFNLPNSVRFDDRTFETKIAFKRWLDQQPVRSDYFKTKGSFRYDMSSMFRNNYAEIIDLIGNSRNIEFTPFLQVLFKNACHDYFRAQRAFLVFSLAVWADALGFSLGGNETSDGLLTGG